jgi:hypothetical protein
MEQIQPLVDAGRKLILVGHSRGGWVVRALACSFPENVRICITVACPHTGQFLVDFNLALGEDLDGLQALIAPKIDETVEGFKNTVKGLIKQVGRLILPDQARLALRNLLGRAREVREDLSEEIAGALVNISGEGGSWDQMYADFNTDASFAANKALPNEAGVVYIDVQGELGEDGFVPPELLSSAAILEMVSPDAVLPPFDPFEDLVNIFTAKHSDGYGTGVEATVGGEVRERRHDGATHSDCCVIPWGRRGPKWPSDNPSTSLVWKLDHCRQVGLFPSPLLVPYITELVDHWQDRRSQMDQA